jgi:flavodoxin
MLSKWSHAWQQAMRIWLNVIRLKCNETMKHLYYYLTVIAMAALVGCKESDKNPETIPMMNTITATITDNPNTKTSIGPSNKILWTASDKVSAFIGSTANCQYDLSTGAGQNSATFTKNSDPEASGTTLPWNVAYYPYNSSVTASKNSDDKAELQVTIPASQTYSAGTFGNGTFPMVAVTSNTGSSDFAFKNLLGVVRFQVTGTATISKVEFQGNNNEVISGSATVVASNVNDPTLTMTGTGTVLTLDCGSGVTLGSTATTFDIAVPPMTFSKGFTVRLYENNSKYMEKSTAKSFTVDRSSLNPISSFSYLASNSSSSNSNAIVVYFSCTGNTKGIADKIVTKTGADQWRINPAVPYTSADLNYNDNTTRATVEQNTPTARPAISGSIGNLSDYDVIYLGYPIWWGAAPKIIYTFLDSYDLTGKTVIPFCTSGSSDIASSVSSLSAYESGATWKTGKRFSSSATQSDVDAWIDGLGLPTTLTVKIEDNATATAFAALLPQTLAMTELNGNEKYHYLSSSLPTASAVPASITAGDVMLYGDKCIVLFYKTFSTTYSYTRIGKVTNPKGLSDADFATYLSSVLGSGDVSLTWKKVNATTLRITF